MIKAYEKILGRLSVCSSQPSPRVGSQFSSVKGAGVGNLTLTGEKYQQKTNAVG